MNKLFSTFLFIFFGFSAFSQNNFLYNPMLYNPAVVGINSVTDVSLIVNNSPIDVNAITRNTQNLNFSTSLVDGKLGIGGNLNRIYQKRDYGIDGSYTKQISEFNVFGAYRILFNKSALSLGTSLGITKDYFHFDYTNVGILPLIEETDYLFNLGLGATFSNGNGFLAISSPNILAKEKYIVYRESRLVRLLEADFRSSQVLALSGGLKLPFLAHAIFIVRPSFTLISNLESILDENPLLQLNVSFQLGQSIWLNTSYNIDWVENISYGDDVEFGIGYHFKNKYRIGFNVVAERFEKKIINPHYLELIIGYRMKKEGDLPPMGHLLLF